MEDKELLHKLASLKKVKLEPSVKAKLKSDVFQFVQNNAPLPAAKANLLDKIAGTAAKKVLLTGAAVIMTGAIIGNRLMSGQEVTRANGEVQSVSSKAEKKANPSPTAAQPSPTATIPSPTNKAVPSESNQNKESGEKDKTKEHPVHPEHPIHPEHPEQSSKGK